MSLPPDEPTFLIDRSLGSRDVPEALRAAGALVEVHDDHFAQDAEDAVWLPAVGAQGWIVLTKDIRIRRHPLELSALMSTSRTVSSTLTATGAPSS